MCRCMPQMLCDDSGGTVCVFVTQHLVVQEDQSDCCTCVCVFVSLSEWQLLKWFLFDKTFTQTASESVSIVKVWMEKLSARKKDIFRYAHIWWRENVLKSRLQLNCNTHTHTFNGPLSGTTHVSRYQKSKKNLDFTEARDSEWQWHQLGHMQVCTSLQTDNHASTPPLSFFTGRMPFLPPSQQR